MPYPQRPLAQTPIANAYRKCPVCRDTCPAKVQIIQSHKKEIAPKASLALRENTSGDDPRYKRFVLSLF